jgi:DNA polymerase III subunit delta'
VPGFESIIGQHLPVRLLEFFLNTGRIPHALLFTGIEGVGKRTTAKLFAEALNCSGASHSTPAPDSESAGRPCGRCRSCRQIQDGGHPDVIEVAPRKGVLRIDQIRGLINGLALKPFGAKHRVVIIAEAHTMNPEAGNALLKILEEPPVGTILILTALQHTDLLPTVASRCRHIRFRPLCVDDLAALLTTQQGMKAEQARTLAAVADGSYTQALLLAESQWSAIRDWMVRAAGLDRLDRGERYTAATALAFSAQLALRKERIESNLEILKTWIRDLGVSNHWPGHVINLDRTAILQTIRARIRDEQITRIWQAVESAQRSIAANGNLRLTLDVMALRMADAMAA